MPAPEAGPVRLTADRADVWTLFCGFCMADEKTAAILIRGPIVCICDQCVRTCAEVVEEHEQQALRDDIEARVAAHRAARDGGAGGDHGP